MRLPANAVRRLAHTLAACGLVVAQAACGMLVGNGGLETTQGAPAPSLGPAADYPIVLGEPFTIDGEIYTPADTLNYDAVGYAGLDGGEGVTAAHRTLPLPSYVEITSLDSGKTILVRVERRGPMSGSNLVSLSAAAVAQLGVSEGAPVRVRRVNPPEAERAELRAGRGAPERMETPKSLVQVLRRKLPAAGAVSLAAARPGGAEPAAQVEASVAPPSVAGAVTAYPLPPPAQAAVAPNAVVVTPTAPAPQASISPPRVAGAAPAASSAPGPVAAAKGAFVIQAGAFANRANAERAAKQLGGFISTSGRLFRVRTGPFATRGQADAALAKVRAAGYSDARVTTAN